MATSVIAADMRLEGDIETVGSLQIDGTIRGNVRAEKSVVVGKDGLVSGSIYAPDAVIAGRVLGAVYAESHLELRATSRISGEIQARRMHVEDGAELQGQIALGEPSAKAAAKAPTSHSSLRGGEEIPWRQLLIRDHDSLGLKQKPASGALVES